MRHFTYFSPECCGWRDLLHQQILKSVREPNEFENEIILERFDNYLRACLHGIIYSFDRIILQKGENQLLLHRDRKKNSQETTFMCTRKQDDICGWRVPALKRVGLACVKYFWDIKL